MGIRGLHICIKKTIPEIVKPVNWSKWSNQRIGIDISCFLYRALSKQESPLEKIAEQIAFFKAHKINIIYVFDGKPPIEKDDVNDKRYIERKVANERCIELKKLLENETDVKKHDLILCQIRDLESRYPILTPQIKEEVKRFIEATGTLFIVPICEADTLLAYWFRRGIIDAIVSHDYDFIARGCRLLAPKQNNNDEWEDYDPIKIRQGLGLNESRFIELCVLMGSDYTPGLPIVPWKLALMSLQSNESIETIWARHTFSNWRQQNVKTKLKCEVDILFKAKRILAGNDDIAEDMIDSAQIMKMTNNPINHEINKLHEFKKLYSDWKLQVWDTILSK
jgi:flap endonuclease-1